MVVRNDVLIFQLVLPPGHFGIPSRVCPFPQSLSSARRFCVFRRRSVSGSMSTSTIVSVGYYWLLDVRENGGRVFVLMGAMWWEGIWAGEKGMRWVGTRWEGIWWVIGCGGCLNLQYKRRLRIVPCTLGVVS